MAAHDVSAHDAAALPVVLFEDNHCLALAKPAGLLTQGVPPGIPTLESQAKEYLKAKYHKAGRVYLGIPHRLDRPVSGVVLFARSTKAAQRLAEQFQNRTVDKTYWGLVEATPPEAEGVWEDWMRKIQEEARSEIARAGEPGAKHAVLSYRVLRTTSAGTLLEFKPQTGRSHQIRLQSASRGLPIRGDQLYGAQLPFGPQSELQRDRAIALHGRSLTFLHPIRYEPVTITAPLPSMWNDLGIDDQVY